jgi:hypothetical protein
MWPPNAKLPAVLNGRCRARLDMSRSSLGVALRDLPARGRSVTFPVWRKRCISRTMMEWLTLISLPVHTYLLTCETGYWSIFIYVYLTGCVMCHVYFSTFVFANESCFFLCRVSFIFYWFGMVWRKLTIPERWQAVRMHDGGLSHRRVADYFRVNLPCVLMWPPNAKLPRNAPAVLNARCRARLDMSRSSLGVVHQTGNVTDRPRASRPRKTMPREDRLISRRARQRSFSTAGALRGKLAFGGHISTHTRSATFPPWRKPCISRTMMEWLTLKWSATLLWLKPPLYMPTACHFSTFVFANESWLFCVEF